jgi:ribosome assembly protein YihI (activator of Der GTPase)
MKYDKPRNPHGCSSIKQVNRRKATGKSSQYFGVHWARKKNKWRAAIKDPRIGKIKHLGLFVEELDAYKAYLAAGREIYAKGIREEAPPEVLLIH